VTIPPAHEADPNGRGGSLVVQSHDFHHGFSGFGDYEFFTAGCLLDKPTEVRFRLVNIDRTHREPRAPDKLT
jgi:hypothetical protein